MILTHNQLALENSLRRILPAGVVSCWIPDGYGRAKDIIRGNHGQCFGTHPNVPVIGSQTEQINACDAIAGWMGTSLSIDEADKKEGIGSLRDDIAEPVAGNPYGPVYNPSGSWDWSERSHVLIKLKNDRASTAFTTARLWIHDILGNYRIWNLTFSAGVWTAVKELLSTGDYQSGTPPNLALINYIRVRFETADTTPFHVKVDDLRVAYRPSFINPSVGWKFYLDDYVEVPGFSKGPNLTIGFWANFVSFPAGTYENLVGDRETSTDWGWLVYRRKGAQKIRVHVLTTGGTFLFDSNTEIDARVWHFIVGTTDGSNLRLFIDTVEDANSPTAYTGTLINPDNKIFIGKDSISPAPNAYITLPFVANKALSQQEHTNIGLATKSLFSPRLF